MHDVPYEKTCSHYSRIYTSCKKYCRNEITNQLDVKQTLVQRGFDYTRENDATFYLLTDYATFAKHTVVAYEKHHSCLKSWRR
jgi:hypothetical protein